MHCILDDQRHPDQTLTQKATWRHESELAVQCLSVRLRSLLLLGGAAGLLFVLATSVGSIKFAPGRPLDLTILSSGGNGSRTDDGGWFLTAMRIALSLSIIGFPFVLTAVLLHRGSRRLVFVWVGVAALIFALRGRLRSQHQRRRQNSEAVPTTIAAAPKRVAEAADRAPSAVALFVSLLISVAVVAMVAWWLRNRRTDDRVARPDSLQATATEAADALRRGDDIEEVIQRCYVRMCEVLQTEANVERPLSMTPSEFQRRLHERSIPASASLTLTSLFERSRYGGMTASTVEQQQAIESLDAIASACRNNSQPAGGDRDEVTV